MFEVINAESMITSTLRNVWRALFGIMNTCVLLSRHLWDLLTGLLQLRWLHSRVTTTTSPCCDTLAHIAITAHCCSSHSSRSNSHVHTDCFDAT